MNNALMFSKASDEWSTPQDFWEALNAEFHFDMDVAATSENTKCELLITQEDDALSMDWGGVCWLNPPYSKCREFIAKAAEQAKKGCTVVCLVPSRTDTRWWHEHVWDRNKHMAQPGVEIRFVKGRLKFGTQAGPIRTSLRTKGGPVNNSAPFPSVVLVFRPC
jgi:phage N-6-adenine-methyltransferase